MRYRSSSLKEPKIFLIMYFWQKNERVIFDDGNFEGQKSSLYPCCFSRKRMVSVSFFSFEKYELQTFKTPKKLSMIKVFDINI